VVLVLIEDLNDISVGDESNSLNTYVPGGKTWAPTPGISTGWLNVTIVFLLNPLMPQAPNVGVLSLLKPNYWGNVLLPPEIHSQKY